MEITKKDAQEARKILKAYERKRNAEKRARQRAMPCAALVHEYLKRKNDGYGYDAWDGDTEYLKACGLTDNAISAMRWKLAHEAIKEAV